MLVKEKLMILRQNCVETYRTGVCKQQPMAHIEATACFCIAKDAFYFFYFLFISIFVYLFIYLWLCWVFVSVRGLSSSCGKWGPLFIAVRGPLTITASLVVEHRLQTRRLSSCGSQAQLLRGMWDLPRPGLEPVSPALAGRFSTTAPPGKSCFLYFKNCKTKQKSRKEYAAETLWPV